MDEAGFTLGLGGLLAMMSKQAENAGLSVKDVQRFSEADIPSSNHGIVVTMADNSQFQVIVTRIR
jgi:hypothetical protein